MLSEQERAALEEQFALMSAAEDQRFADDEKVLPFDDPVFLNLDVNLTRLSFLSLYFLEKYSAIK